MQAIECGATLFLTSGAIMHALQLINGICMHENCQCSSLSHRYVPMIKVKAVGGFSQHKGGGPLDQVLLGLSPYISNHF